jgi:hypothetical protein
MQLTREEVRALLTWTKNFQTPDDFGVFLMDAIVVDYRQFARPQVTVAVVAVDFVGWLQLNMHYAVELYGAAIVHWPAHPAIADLQATLERLRAGEARAAAAGPSYEHCLPGGVPVVNRLPLRGLLKGLCQGIDYPVILVEGDRGLGRSHSWHLIQHVAMGQGARPLRVDLLGPTLRSQSVEALFDYLTRVLGLQDGVTPTSEGVTGVTLAQRFSGEFVARVQSRPSPWGNGIWLVFDNLDRDVPPETKLFIMQLAQMRLNKDFTGATLFLLGPDPTAGMDDPYLLVRRERLTSFQADELRSAVTAVNAVGQAQLNTAELEAEAQAVLDLAGAQQGRELGEAVMARLARLRDRVQA